MIVDANVIVSAVLGRSLPLLFQRRLDGIELRAPVHQIAEAMTIVQRKADLPDEVLMRQMEALETLIDPIEPDVVMPFEQQARRRLGRRGQPDWPVLAAALALGDAIWSNDRDFFGVGVPVWSTGNIAEAEIA